MKKKIKKLKHWWKSLWFYDCKQVPSKKPHKDWNKKFRTSVSHFRCANTPKDERLTYSYREVLEHLGGMKTKCYLTGIPINIETDDYQLDHIIPVSKGGSNKISNCGITIPLANQMKTDMTVPELLEMCEKILKHHNYKVEKPALNQ